MRAFETQVYTKFLYLMWEFRNVIPNPTRFFGKVSLKNNIYHMKHNCQSSRMKSKLPNNELFFLLCIIRLSTAFVARVTEWCAIVAVSRGELNDNGICLMLVLYAKCNSRNTAVATFQIAEHILYR